MPRSLKLLTLTLSLALLAPVATGAPSAGAAAPSLQQRAKALGLTCSKVTTSDKLHYTKCTGEIPSFDGIGLDTDLSLPSGADAPLPTIVMLHGWSGDKTDWEADSAAGGGKDDWHWNNVWFATHGWAVVNYTARGFEESCGQSDQDANCADGYTHLADRAFETRDSQTLLGKLVDAHIADAKRLASTGGSYGGGQTWLLATSMPWKSPKGARLQLAAGVAKYPWTDLLDSLAPNGRATPAVHQPLSHTVPFGVPKLSYISGLYAVGRAEAQGRYDTNPTDYGTNLDEQYQRVQQGEPYDPSTDPRLQGMVDSFISRSPFLATEYFQALTAHVVRPVPMMSIQGWTDPLFPAVQTLQMFRKLKEADPSYPIKMVFGDVGHSNAANPAWQWHPINTLANRFLNAEALGRTKQLPSKQTYSFRTRCDIPKKPIPPTAGGWGALSHGVAGVTGTGTQTTSSADNNPQDGAASDPIANGGCLTEDAGTVDPQGAYWTFPADGLHLIGLPTVKVDYSMTGQDAVVAFKLWDLAQDGSKTLVTRGEYRLSTAAGDPAQGTLTTHLYGNDWVFAPGHQIQLQITQNDSPYLRVDNLPSTIDFSAPHLALPVRTPVTISALRGRPSR